MSNPQATESALGGLLAETIRAEVAKGVADALSQIQADISLLRDNVLPGEDKGLSIREACDRLGVSRSILERWILDGIIRPVPNAKPIRISSQQIHRVLTLGVPALEVLPRKGGSRLDEAIARANGTG